MAILTKIDVMAHDILKLLEKTSRPITIQELKQCLKRPSEIILIGLGRLIAKDYIRLEVIDGKCFVLPVTEHFVHCA